MSSYFPEHRIKKFNLFEDINDIRASLAGSRDLWTDARQSLTLNYDKEWKRPRDICDNPVFVDGKPSRFDALQGTLEDCWLVAGIEVITLNDELINFVVPPGQSFDHNYIGAFHFRIWHFGSWYDVVVDDRLPVFRKNHQLAYIHSKRRNIFWAPLLEKAYSKVYHDTRTKLYYIDDVGSGGYTMDSLQDFSGGIVETVLTNSTPPAKMKWFINEVFSKHALMCCERFNYLGNKPALGLQPRHAYIVSNVWKCSDDDPVYPGLNLIRVMNPWGDTEWQGEWRDNHYYLWRQIDQKIKQRLEVVDRNDGEFWMSEEDFVKYFESLYICHLGPGQYISSRQGVENRSRTWTTIALSGEWVKDISAGGHSSANRYKNPQYMLLVEMPHGTNSESVGKVDLIIELVQILKYGRFIRSGIAFFVYSLKHLYHPSMPLDKEFFRKNSPLNNYPMFFATAGRSSVLSMKLEEGRYCIVPCTENENEDAYFLLRVYCQSPVSLSLINHDKVSKKCPTEEQTPNESDEWLEKLFNDTAQGQDEINWFGLKEILETAMNPSRSYFGLITSLFNFIGDIFENHFSLRSYNVCDTEDVVFTKDECRSMIAMMDDNHSGKLSFSEFSNIWNKICFWTKVYKQHRDETEGYLTVPQLRDALSAIGYDLSKQTVHSLVYVYANDQGHIFLTDFILCGVTLETVLSLCQKEDVEDVNTITFTLEEWVKNTLIL